MSKSLRYWSEKYDSIARQRQRFNADPAWYTLDLLAAYAGFYKTLIFPHAWGGQIHRFFTGRWNTNHGNDIQLAIRDYYEMDTIEANDTVFLSNELILGFVKKQLNGKAINPQGDLAKVLQVIKLKTGVDYFNLPTNDEFSARVKRLYA